jgi:CheY-like chemotaxis protein
MSTGREGYVLFNEREGVDCRALKRLLEQEGLRVACASDEQEARDLLRRAQRPDLVLLDLAPPATGAARFVEELKQDAANASVPVVVFCPTDSPFYPAAFPAADTVLHKPVEYATLLATVRAYCTVRPSACPPARPSLPAGASGRGQKVLIVEDDPDTAETLRLLLAFSGHRVMVASTGPDGVRAARQWGPDVVLCDLGLPGLDGFGVAGELREDPATAQARLIAVTAYGGEEADRRARESGFDLLLTKPGDPAALLQLLHPGDDRGRAKSGP